MQVYSFAPECEIWALKCEIRDTNKYLSNILKLENYTQLCGNLNKNKMKRNENGVLCFESTDGLQIGNKVVRKGKTHTIHCIMNDSNKLLTLINTSVA